MGRRLISRPDLMVPSVSRKVQQSQSPASFPGPTQVSVASSAVIMRLLRETECMPAGLFPEQEPSGYQVKWYRRQDHFHAKYRCRTKLFGRGTRITFESVSLDSQKRLRHLLMLYLKKSDGSWLPTWVRLHRKMERPKSTGYRGDSS